MSATFNNTLQNNIVRTFDMRKVRGLAYNPHFWALIVIIIVLSVFYYSLVFLGFRFEWSRQLKITEYRNAFHGILFCIPIVYAAMVFKWRGILITWLVSLTLAMPLAFYYSPFNYIYLRTFIYFCIPILIIGLVTLELEWRKKEQQVLIERDEERNAYLAQVLQAQEEERKRIAQELHDDTIHSLLLITNELQKIHIGTSGQLQDQIKQNVERIRDDILRVSDDLRRLSMDLRPGILDHLGFIPAIRWLIERLNQENQIDTKMIIKGNQRQIPQGTDVVLLRIVQEALNNIRIHSEATEATITLEFTAKRISLTIYDNGKGFNLPKRMNVLSSKGKLGLVGIAERTRSINSTYRIQTKPGCGTLITIKLTV